MTGQTISHYQVMEKLGEGGMGVVYKARDTRLGRNVVLKFVKRQFTERFEREARAIAALNHPHICTLYDVGQHEGQPFLVMEFVEGKPLPTPLPLNETLRLAIQIASAVTAAHAKGIVHRDLKPSNILLDTQGEAKVLDFGLAKLIEEPPGADDRTLTKHATEEGRVVGTAAYMSPEQAEGKKVDARSDIFSFGSLLYEMITGRNAFEGDSKMSTLAAIINCEPKPLAGVVPHDLERLIERCLRKDPNRRVQHMDDVKLALEDLKQDSESGRLAPVASPVAQPRGRRWLLPAITSAAVVLAGALGWTWFMYRSDPARQLALTVLPLTATAGHELAPSFSPDGTQVAFVWNGENQDNYDVYVKLIGAERPLRLTSAPSPEAFPQWSPDGRWIAFNRAGAGSAAVYLIPPIGGTERRLTDHVVNADVLGFPGPYHAWTADSKSLVLVTKEPRNEPHSLWLVPLSGGSRTRLTRPQTGAGDTTPAVSPDGRYLAFCRIETFGTGDLYVMELDQDRKPRGEPRKVMARKGMPVTPAWSPDSRELVFALYAGQDLPTLHRVFVTGGTAQPLGLGGEGDIFPTISRDGRRLAFSRARRDVNIYRLDLTQEETAAGEPRMFISSTREDQAPRFSPDGTRIAFTSIRSGSKEIWVCRSDGTGDVQLTSLRASFTGNPHWSPDGRWLAFTSSTAGNWDAYVISSDGGTPRRITPGAGQEHVEGWSHDSKCVYVVEIGQGTRLIRLPLAGGDPVAVLDKVVWPRESPDGQWLYFKRSGSDKIWRVPLADGLPQGAATELPISVYRDHLHVVDDGIYFIGRREPDGTRTLAFHDLRNSRTRAIYKIRPPVMWGLTVSPDRRTAIFTQQNDFGSDLMLIEDFR